MTTAGAVVGAVEGASPPGGLSAREVAERVADGRVNRFSVSAGRSTAQIIWANVFTLFNLIVGVLFVVMLFVGPIQDALFGLVAIANTLIGTVQELRAKRSLEQLALIGRPKVGARRDGRVVELQPDEVVLDDVLVLSSGTQAVVDGIVAEAEALEIDESLLTGESDPVVKQPGDAVMSGSFAVAGTGAMRVTAVGADSYAAKLVAEASRFQVVQSQIRSDINRVLKIITWVIVPISALLAFSQLRDGEELDDAISGTVAGIITMIPEGLVLLTSIAFAVGVVRLGRQGCLVQELSAVEGLARVDVVCADKTGTLTEDRMEVGELLPLDGAAEAEARNAFAALAAADEAPNASMLAIAAACPDAPGWVPTSRAAFSSARKWSGVSFGDHGNWLIGAPEMLLPAGSPAIAEAGTRADQGMRVLLLGRSDLAVDDPQAPGAVAPVALVALAQAVRPDSGATLDYFRQQGVAVKVISGDDPRTVGSIAARLGLDRADRPVDARTLGDDEAKIAAAVAEASVFGRVTPHQKRAMVGALQASGHTVAMTGDGVNDVLALKDADVGVSMGSGSAATRSVAQLVLLDNKFAVLPVVVAEGRKVIGNVERVAKLFLTKTMYGALMAVCVGIIGLPFPFLPRHLTVVTALTIGIPSFVLAFTPNRDPVAPNMVARVLRFSVPAGLIVTMCSFGSYWVGQTVLSTTLAEDRTTATISLVIVGLGVLVAVASPLAPWKVGLVAAMAGLFVLCLTVPWARRYLALDPSEAIDTVISIGVSLVGAIVVIIIGHHTIPSPSPTRPPLATSRSGRAASGPIR
ncbi:MAG: HAD-IC family P-type ATPase [Ilumatobacteraceae bacterium]